MPESGPSFQSLPPEYQQAVQLAQDRYGLSITPLQQLVGGWSGAYIYLVSVTARGSGRVEHLVMKLDRKRPMAASDEVTRHQSARAGSPPDFARRHIPELVYERVDSGGVLVIFYSIAGQSLLNFQTLSKYRKQNELETLFKATNHYLLDGWNANLAVEQIDHPQSLLDRWLGFRLDPGQKIERFLLETSRVQPDLPGFIIQGGVYPNPLYFARSRDPWDPVRPGDALVGLQHSDLNTNNILAKFTSPGGELEGYFLIDFALFKEKMPLLYDQRYLEMSYLVHALSQGSMAAVVDLITRQAEHEILETHQATVEMAGVNRVIRAGRVAFGNWVRENHPTLHDDLWGQYWLAGAAAGLSYCHKAGQADEIRLAGLVFAAANLKTYFNLLNLPMPAEATLLAWEGLSSRSVQTRQKPGFPTGRPPHNLPVPPTNFIGRATELADLSDLLERADVRLVTLTGPGGTGKTRLGLEVGRAVLKHFENGVYFIDLAPLRDPDLIVTTTAHTIGIREGGGRPLLENLTDFLTNKRMLLIFDNFEQITDAAPALAEILSAAEGVKALVTSRIPLQLRGEHEYPVSPLRTPRNVRQTLAETQKYEAVALFRQQAKSVQQDFELTEANSAAVVEICQRLDGLPLAIEIAAARIKILPPQALLKRLDQRLKLLVGGARDLPVRQQTLRRTIDWSYELLKPEEQILFAWLGIFAGGFTLDAAEGVCNLAGELDVFSGIESLINNSLLRQVQSVSAEPRFDMLQTLREYALEKAIEAGKLVELHSAHCDYFTQLAGGVIGTGVFGSESASWLQRFEEEHDNFRVALSWALEQGEEGIFPVISMMWSLTWFWYRYGHLKEGSEWTERALAAARSLGESPGLALALCGRAYLALWSGDLKIAAEYAGQAVDIAARLSFDQGLSMAKLAYGTILINQGRDKEAYPHLVDAAELFDQQDQSWMKGTTLVHLANVSLGLGDPAQAVKWLDMAMPFMQESGDPWSLAFALNNFGEVARAQGDYDKAEHFYHQTEALYKQADAKGDQARLVHTFGYIAMHKGDFEGARARFQQSLTDFRELGNHRGIAECLAGLAVLAAQEGAYGWAAPLLGAAEGQLIALGGGWWPADRVEIDRARMQLNASLGEDFETSWAQGQTMGVDEAITYGLQADGIDA